MIPTVCLTCKTPITAIGGDWIDGYDMANGSDGHTHAPRGESATRRWQVMAQVITTTRTKWTTSHGVPLFFVDAASEGDAFALARNVIFAAWSGSSAIESQKADVTVMADDCVVWSADLYPGTSVPAIRDLRRL